MEESWCGRRNGGPCSDECSSPYRTQRDDAEEARKAAEKQAHSKPLALAVMDSQPDKDLLVKVDIFSGLLAGHDVKWKARLGQVSEGLQKESPLARLHIVRDANGVSRR